MTDFWVVVEQELCSILNVNLRKVLNHFRFIQKKKKLCFPPGRQFQVIGCLDQGNGLHIIQMKEIQPKFPLINPVQLSSTISPSSLSSPASLVVSSEIKIQTPQTPFQTRITTGSTIIN